MQFIVNKFDSLLRMVFCVLKKFKEMITSENIKNFPDLNKSGLSPRKTRKGPELDFLQKYLQSYLPLVPKGQELTVFIEPNVDSVFPDAVAVY